MAIEHACWILPLGMLVNVLTGLSATLLLRSRQQREEEQYGPGHVCALASAWFLVQACLWPLDFPGTLYTRDAVLASHFATGMAIIAASLGTGRWISGRAMAWRILTLGVVTFQLWAVWATLTRTYPSTNRLLQLFVLAKSGH